MFELHSTSTLPRLPRILATPPIVRVCAARGIIWVPSIVQDCSLPMTSRRPSATPGSIYPPTFMRTACHISKRRTRPGRYRKVYNHTRRWYFSENACSIILEVCVYSICAPHSCIDLAETIGRNGRRVRATSERYWPCCYVWRAPVLTALVFSSPKVDSRHSSCTILRALL